MSEEVNDYGEPWKFDGHYFVSRGSAIVQFAKDETRQRIVSCINLLAGIETDPVLMDSRTEKVIGLLRAIADGDEGAFRGNLDDLAAREILVGGETFEEHFAIQYNSRSDPTWIDDNRCIFADLYSAQEQVNLEKTDYPASSFRIVRVLTKTKVVE